MTSSDQRHPLGPPDPAPQPAAGFSITGPAEVTLGADRSAVTTFSVTNVTGRPVRVRLRPQPGGSADAGWLSLVGDSERPVAIAATLSVDVKIAVPPTAPAGAAAVRLDVVAEDNTEVVTGQSVAFIVPAPVVKGRPRWLIPAVIAAVVLLVAAGVYFVVKPSSPPPVAAPTNLVPPAVTGAPMVGATLLADKGSWTGQQLLLVRWQRCPGGAATACANIQTTVAVPTSTGSASPTESASAGPTASPSSAAADAGMTDGYVVSTADAGNGLRIEVTAYAVAGDADAVAGGPQTIVASPVVLVPQVVAPPQTTVVPNFSGLDFSAASAAANGAHLNLGALVDGPIAPTCNPLVSGQNPRAGSSQPWGTLVTVLIQPVNRRCLIFVTRAVPLQTLQVNGGK